MTNKIKVLPPMRDIGGRVEVISSKSELHRLIICACLSDKGCTVGYSSEISKDIIATVGVFKSLGADIETAEGKITVKRPIDIEKVPHLVCDKTEIFCNESGSTARFILPLVSLICKNGVTVTGQGKLPERPFSDLCRCLEAHGASFSSDKMPIRIQKTASPSGVFEISGNISSQYLSGLLFILPLCDGCSIKLTTPLESSGYVDMTIEAMKRFGITVTVKDGVYTASGKYTTLSECMVAGGDWSNASFFLCAAKEKKLTVGGISDDSLQPDRKIIEILTECGYNIENGKDFVSITRGENIVPFDTDAGETPDSVPILSVLAASINGKSTIRNIRRLRYKESDRVSSVCDMIDRLGGKIEADENCITVYGTGKLSGGTVDSFNDHRIAMAASIASLICEKEVTVVGADAVAKSYPSFYEELEKLMGDN